MKPAHIIAIVALAIFLVALGVNLSQNASIYTDFATAKASNNQVHIVGKWVQRDQASYDQSQDLFSFYMQDTLKRVEMVHYFDPKPINFEQAEKVVVVGGYKQDQFVADKIVMKCPSKYEPTDIAGNE
ncbi:MAG: cytochrome c maturation protein CcmE [Bacteroidota bacterium]